MSAAQRIAMWSGPRNISTAMMRSWENREDCVVCDEPLYAYFLKRTGLPHPGAAEVIEAHESDWERVTQQLTGPIPEGASIYYQKQMAHHLLPEIDRGWLDALTHVFLIRNPREMIASYLQRRDEIELEDTGLPQQLEIFERVLERSGELPPVIDSTDVLRDPRGMLGALCARLGLPFSDRMLEWPAGKRTTDGVWAKHWYDAVEASTAFQPYRPKEVVLDDEQERLAERCEPLYRKLHDVRMVLTP